MQLSVGTSPQVQNTKGIYIILRSSDIESTRQYVVSNNGTVHTVISSIMTLTISPDKLLGLAERQEVNRIESSKPVKFTSKKISSKKNDQQKFPSVLQLTEADKLHSENNPDKRSYTGKGVIVGIIDTGIDFLHPDFAEQGDTLKTRILGYWNQNDSITKDQYPTNFTYGREVKRDQIQQIIAKQDTTLRGDLDGHGTHVAGIAAGAGNIVADYKGLAPDAEFVAVSMDNFNSLKIIDAAKYIFDVADRVGKPVVINMSLGFADQLNDGKSLVDIALTEFVEQKAGRVLVAAAGNEGGTRNRWIIPSSPNSTVVRTNYIMGDIYWASQANQASAESLLAMLIPESHIEKIFVGSGLDSVASAVLGSGDSLQIQLVPQGNTKMRTVQEILNNGSFTDTLRYQRSGAIAGTIDWIARVSTVPGNVELSILLNDTLTKRLDTTETTLFKNGHDLFRLNVCSIDRPVSVNYTFLSTNQLPSNIKGLNTKPEDGTWSEAMTVSSPASAMGVVAVGSYDHRPSYVGLDGKEKQWSNVVTTGKYSSFSSVGPTLDGRMKPDICAPGAGVISALTSAPNSSATPDDIVQGGRFMIASGTSMSSPVVAGGIAQYLQKYPTKTYKEIRAEIQQRAVSDAFTSSNGSLPNNYWGYGKFSAYNLFFPTNSTVDEQVINSNGVFVSPNPASGTVRISCPAISGATKVEVYNLVGEKVLSVSAPDADLTIDTQSLITGLYVVDIVSGEQKKRTYLTISR